MRVSRCVLLVGLSSVWLQFAPSGKRREMREFAAGSSAEDLVRGWQEERSEKAARALEARYSKSLAAYACRLFRIPADEAGSIAQYALAKALDRWDESYGFKFSTLCYTIMRNDTII